MEGPRQPLKSEGREKGYSPSTASIRLTTDLDSALGGLDGLVLLCNLLADRPDEAY